tara:strand:- start:3873 stop:4061 length:189 start_codon:yes stop_codon:yes gene_type:complete
VKVGDLVIIAEDIRNQWSVSAASWSGIVINIDVDERCYVMWNGEKCDGLIFNHPQFELERVS